MKRAGVPLAEIGLLNIFSGEKMPSSLRMRRLTGLNKFGLPGDSGRLLGRDLLADGRLGLEGRNCSRGNSWRGPGRCMATICCNSLSKTIGGLVLSMVVA